MDQKKAVCPDCEAGAEIGIERRQFLRAAGATAVAALPLWAVPRLAAAPTPSSAAETAVKALMKH